jgi:hypothetical protein
MTNLIKTTLVIMVLVGHYLSLRFTVIMVLFWVVYMIKIHCHYGSFGSLSIITIHCHYGSFGSLSIITIHCHYGSFGPLSIIKIHFVIMVNFESFLFLRFTYVL